MNYGTRHQFLMKPNYTQKSEEAIWDIVNKIILEIEKHPEKFN